MKQRFGTLILLLFCVPATLALWTATDRPAAAQAPAAVQEQDPFDDVFGDEEGDEPQPEEEPQPADAQPDAEGPEEEGDEPDAEAAKPLDERTPGPAVLAIRESNPTTPLQLARAAHQLADLGHPNEAKLHLQTLLASNPPPAVLVALERRLGSSRLLRMARNERLDPEGKQLAEMVLEAATRWARDPQRLATSIERLNDPDESVRYQVIADLRRAGPAAVAPLIRGLQIAANRRQHARVQAALLDLGPTAVGPLVGTLASTDPAQRLEAIEALGRLAERSALVYLLAPYFSSQSGPAVRQAAGEAIRRIAGGLPTRQEAEAHLHGKVRSLLSDTAQADGGRQFGDLEQSVELWQWDQQQGQSVPARYSKTDAALVTARVVAGELYSLAPDNPQYRRLYLSTQLEWAKVSGSLSVPLATGPDSPHALAAAAGPEVVEDVLAHALATDRPAAAMAAVEVLGDIGSEDLLLSRGGLPRPLAAALSHGDRRLRFAAVQAIMKIDPADRFFGSSRLCETLGHFAAAGGTRRVLIGHPTNGRSQRLATMLAALGFEADLAVSGRRLFQLAVGSPDYELVLLSEAVDRPRARQLIHMLRRDGRTAAMPIGVMTRADTTARTQRLYETDRRTAAFVWPSTAESLAAYIERLVAASGRDPLSPEERLAQAGAAIDGLGRLAARPRGYAFYDVRQHQHVLQSALDVPELSAKAARVLGRLGSPPAQRALVSVASQNARPLPTRQAAAEAFGAAVRRRRLLLTAKQVRQQYDRYHQSAELDRATRQVLGLLLQSIEGPRERQQPNQTKVPAR